MMLVSGPVHGGTNHGDQKKVHNSRLFGLKTDFLLPVRYEPRLFLIAVRA